MRADTQTLTIRAPERRAGDAPRRIVDDLARRSLFALFGRITGGSIAVVEGEERFSFGATSASLAVTITVVDPATRSVVGTIAGGE